MEPTLILSRPRLAYIYPVASNVYIYMYNQGEERGASPRQSKQNGNCIKTTKPIYLKLCKKKGKEEKKRSLVCVCVCV